MFRRSRYPFSFLAGPGEGDHKISGPLTTGEGGAKKTRASTSILANAFQNAWKQGSLAVEVSLSV